MSWIGPYHVGWKLKEHTPMTQKKKEIGGGDGSFRVLGERVIMVGRSKWGWRHQRQQLNKLVFCNPQILNSDPQIPISKFWDPRTKILVNHYFFCRVVQNRLLQPVYYGSQPLILERPIQSPRLCILFERIPKSPYRECFDMPRISSGTFPLLDSKLLECLFPSTVHLDAVDWLLLT
jgi:hypothetical protein